jgi:hypothetical protein
VPVTLLGLAFMAREGLTFARMKQMASENKPGEGPSGDRAPAAASEGRPPSPKATADRLPAEARGAGGGGSAQRGGETKGAPPSGVIK